MALAELHENGLGRHYLKYARQLDLLRHDIVGLDLPERTRISPSTRDVSLRFPHHRADITNAESLGAFLDEPSVPGIELDDFWYLIEGGGLHFIAGLLKEFENLLELNYFVQGTFPVRFAQAIKDYHPSCRLNLWGSQSPGFKGTGSECNANPDFYALDVLSSPRLEAFTLGYPLTQPPRQIQSNEVFGMLAQAPNLKHLRIPEYIFDRHGGAIHWGVPEGFLALEASSVCRLQSLALPFRGVFTGAELLEKLARVFVLSGLLSLDISLSRDPTSVQEIAPALKSIERLSVSWQADTYANAMRDLNHAEEDRHIAAAVSAFRRLKYLRMQGIRKVEALYSILSYHGRSLKGLSIQPNEGFFGTDGADDEGYRFPVLSSNDIHEVSELCPNLQELRIQVQRTMGSTEECNIYTALGSFPNLQTLFLDLHYDPRSPPLSSAPDETELFTNAATDEKLATAIFNIIYNNQPWRNLRNLRLTPFGRKFLFLDTKYVISFLAKSMLVKRRSFSLPETLETIQIGVKETLLLQHYLKCDLHIMEIQDREERDVDFVEAEILAMDPVELLDRDTKRALGRIYPEIVDWRESWHSFPLQM